MAKLPDFDSLSIPELRELITAAQGVLDKKVDARRAELEAELESLGGQKASPKSKPVTEKRGTVKPAFVGPNGESWAGRGATPKWLVELESKGKSREEYRVK
jgi:DNA-binding protein H-NS